jgi:hypothetical protein
MIAAKDPDLFRVGNQFTHGMDIKRLGINPLVKRCGINPALWFLMMSKISSRTGINPGLYIIYIDFSIVFVISVRIESRGNELALRHFYKQLVCSRDSSSSERESNGHMHGQKGGLQGLLRPSAA